MIHTIQPTPQQKTSGVPARVPLVSETYVPHVMPPIFGTGDLLVLLLLNTLWVTNITPIAAGGPVGFLYWLLCGAAFFGPCSLVMAQLAKLFPYEGGIVNWTYQALGHRWSFFVGICTWVPGLLSIVNAAAAMISWIQVQDGAWVTQPWQQGIAMLIILLLSGILACQRTRIVQHVLNVAAGFMGIATVMVVCAAIFWLVQGHHPATNLALASSWTIRPSNFALLGSATLALLGSNMPLVLAGEIHPQARQHVIARHLTWGTVGTLGGYVLFTAAVLIVQGSDVASRTVNPMVLLIQTVARVFGTDAGKVMALCLGIYFLMIPVALHLCFARFLTVGAIDRRISIWFARLNRHRVPINALGAQIAITIGLALVLYVLVPSISFLGQAADLSNIAYNVLGASLLLIWSFSFLFPFIDVAVVYFTARAFFLEHTLHLGQLPRHVTILVLVYCVISGSLLCLVTIGCTLWNSFIPTLIPNSSWGWIIGGIALGSLLLFAACSLLSSSEARWEEMHR